MQVLNKQLAENTAMKAKLDSNERHYRHYSSERNAMRTSAPGTVTIPVVVHVLYTQSVENISDAQITSQITALNRDYSRANTDISKVPGAFTNVIGNANIQFALAKRDPNGQVTTGIHRLYTTKTSFDSDLDEAKFTSKGGTDAWPRDKYLNIWVVPSITASGSTTLGYASFPGGPANADGVVIAYQYFGTTGPVKAAFNMGRTGTHEVGHWLNLYHTFEGGCNGNTTSSCMSDGDYICDTPPTSTSNFQCPSTQNTCTETPTDQNDMTMNYMDYVNDNCMYMFSAGQVTRMQATLNGSRSPIKTSDALTDPNIQLDAGIYEIISPSETVCTNNIDPVIKITNYGAKTITSMRITYALDAGSTYSFTYNGSVVKNGVVEITLPAISNITAGSHTFQAAVTLVNGVADDNSANNQLSISFTVQSTQQLPFTETFANSSTLAGIWEIENPDASYTWESQNLNTLSVHDHCISINNFDYKGGNGQIDALISPLINILATSTLQFDIAYKLFTPVTNTAENYSDTLQIIYSDDCGASFHTLYKKAGLDLTTSIPYYTEDRFIPRDDEWRTETVDLSTLNGKSVIFAFVNITDNENVLYLDEIQITSLTGFDDELIEKNSLSVYPNPGKNDFTIASLQDIQSLHVTDITGREIYHASPLTTKYQLHLENINAGVYLIKVGFRNSEQVLKLVVE